MSEPVLSVQAAPPPPAVAVTPLQLVRLPVEKSQMAVAFLRARTQGVMDLIAHFWEGLAQTPPLQRPDLHLVVALEASLNLHINMSILDPAAFCGAMLYVPKAHRADILAVSPAAAGALAAYISHLGAKQVHPPIQVFAEDAAVVSETPVESGERIPTLTLTDLSGKQPAIEEIPAESGRTGNGSSGPSGGGANHAATNGLAGLPIDFLTGDAAGIGWIVPLLLPLVHKRSPARQLVNVVMQLPTTVAAAPDPHVRPAREHDVPLLNRWRRLYKEERGIHFDADMDALVQNQRVFVYDLPLETSTLAAAATIGERGGAASSNGAGGKEAAGSPPPTGGVVAVAKIDLDLQELVEIGGVYTFPEHRHHGYGATLMSDMAHRIRQSGKMPTLQVDESNVPALRLYEKMGWRSMGKLARVWLTG